MRNENARPTQQGSRDAGLRKPFVAPAYQPKGNLTIHFCSGINLWDGPGTIQCN